MGCTPLTSQSLSTANALAGPSLRTRGGGSFKPREFEPPPTVAYPMTDAVTVIPVIWIIPEVP